MRFAFSIRPPHARGLTLGRVAALGGPPFQTDDPEPIDFEHYEFYTFASSDGTPVETDTVGPAVEFNWGALPNVHLHIVVPAAAVLPSNNSQPRACRNRPASFRRGRYRSRHQVPLCSRDRAPAHDRHVHQVQDPDLGSEKLWPVDHVRRWRSYRGARARLPQFPLRRLAGATRRRKKNHARDRSVSSRAGRNCDATNSRGDDGRRGRLLQIPRSWISIAVLLRPYRGRANRELRLPGILLDVGIWQTQAWDAERAWPACSV